MLPYDLFVSALHLRAESRVDRGVLIVSFLKNFENHASSPLALVRKYFEYADLAVPSNTVLGELFSSDKRVSIRSGVVRSLHKGDAYLKETYPDLFEDAPEETKLPAKKREQLSSIPYVDSTYVDELQRMLDLYASLHTLENSMRRLIEKELANRLGADWWEKAANAPLKKKHADRLEKERTKKWLPARSVLGPLYSLDWSDLISIMRRYEDVFVPIIGDVNFLHRFSDLGLLRHVIAHNGFVDDPKDYDRVNLALHDWTKQIGQRA